MSQCKPCLTIRAFLKILWLNSKLFVSNVRSDMRSYSNINATVCELDHITSTTVNPEVLTEQTRTALSIVQDIRKAAKDNYIPTETETKEGWVAAAETYLANTTDGKETTDRVRQMLERYKNELARTN